MAESQPYAVFVDRLSKLGAGERARLKRCAGQTIGDSRELGLFYNLIAPCGIPEYQEGTYFLVATLYPLAENADTGDFGNSLRKARDDQNHKSLDKRVRVLLDSDEGQLSFRLRQSMHYLHSRPEKVRVNWQKLTDDLLNWNLPNHMVQRRWARNYFAE